MKGLEKLSDAELEELRWIAVGLNLGDLTERGLNAWFAVVAEQERRGKK